MLCPRWCGKVLIFLPQVADTSSGLSSLHLHTEKGGGMFASYSDGITTFVGVLLAVGHQVGLVGVVPQTRQDWCNTGISVALGVLGYYSNKTTKAP